MTTAEKCKAFEEQVERAVSEVRNKLDEHEWLTELSKGTVTNAYRLGWIDGWAAYAERGGKTNVAYLIQDALNYFADTCPHCERELDIDVDAKQINAWLGGKNE